MAIDVIVDLTAIVGKLNDIATNTGAIKDSCDGIKNALGGSGSNSVYSILSTIALGLPIQLATGTGVTAIITALGSIATQQSDANSILSQIDQDISTGFGDVVSDTSSIAGDLSNISDDISASGDTLSGMNTKLGTIAGFPIQDIASGLASVSDAIGNMGDDVGGIVDSLDELPPKLTAIADGLSSVSGGFGDVKTAINSVASKVDGLPKSFPTIDLSQVPTPDLTAFGLALGGIAALSVQAIDSYLETMSVAIGNLPGIISTASLTIQSACEEVAAKISPLHGEALVPTIVDMMRGVGDSPGLFDFMASLDVDALRANDIASSNALALSSVGIAMTSQAETLVLTAISGMRATLYDDSGNATMEFATYGPFTAGTDSSGGFTDQGGGGQSVSIDGVASGTVKAGALTTA